MKSRTPVLMIGLDAAEWTLVQRLMDAGKLPILAKLRRLGCHGELTSPALSYAGGVWPSFYTGQDVPWHGIFHNKQWRPEAMRCEVPTERWIASRPFWEQLGDQGYRLCIVDVPMILGQPPAINGLYLGGWGTHDLISKGSSPGALWSELRKKYGAPIMPAEYFGAQNAAALARLTDALLRSTAQMQRIACDLLGREQWDFSCVVFGGTHRVGHYLWDLSQLDEDALPVAQREALQAALTTVYQATDHALGRVLEQVSTDTMVIAFAVHGMGPNPGWSDLVPDILDAAHRSAGREQKKGLLYALRRHLPFEWVRPVLTRLPMAVTERLVSTWSARMYDWSSTRHYPVPMDHAGYLRINLRGREHEGLVEQGTDYDDACRHLEQIFAGLRDCDTNQPIVARISRGYAESPAEATHRDLMPDLLITWQGPSATRMRELSCDALPSFRFELPQRLPSGRAGNHTGHGWFIASGPDVEHGLQSNGHDILDLAPTMLHVLGAEPMTALQGRPITFRTHAQA